MVDGTPFALTVIDCVGSSPKVESYERIRGRMSVPFAKWCHEGWASTGRISPPPGCSLVLLSVNSVFQ